MLSKKTTVLIATGLFLLSAFFSYQYFKPFLRIKIKDKLIRVNPDAQIDPKKEYRLRLWDYDYPLRDCNYREYLERAVAGFRKSYPNIQVEIRLLDLFTGPGELEAVLEQGDPPDLYCSAFVIPPFDLRYQIPVGPYLQKPTGDPGYIPKVQQVCQVDGVLGCFPRWIRLNLWVGNRTLLEAAGFDVDRIQQAGWTWSQWFAGQAKYPSDRYSMVGNVIPLEILRQILPNGCFVEREGENGWDWLQQFKDTQRLPEDFNSNMLERFLSGQAMLLAEVSPVMLKVIEKRLAEKGAGWEPVVLPAPELGRGRAIHSVEPGVICVYRNRKRGAGGSDQLVAAVKLGEYLSTYRDTAPWEELMVLPATRQAALNWEQKLAGSSRYPAVLEMMVNRNNLTTINPDRTYRRSLAWVLLQYLTNKISREEAVQRLKEEIYCD